MNRRYLWQIIVFFLFMIPGMWFALTDLWGLGLLWLIAAFLVGGLLSRLVFKRIATKEQIREELEHRWFADDLHPGNQRRRK